MVATIFRVPTCPVCYSEFDSEEAIPRLLFNCGHVVCQQCLTQLYGHYSPDSTTTFTCYKCKTQHSIEGQDKQLLDHFPRCSNILRMTEPPKVRFQCVHFDYLPGKHLCFSKNCPQPTPFCVLCLQAIHHNCNSDLIIKLEDFGEKVDFRGFEEVPLRLDQLGRRESFRELVADCLGRVNRHMADVRPADFNDFIKKQDLSVASFEDGKIKLSYVQRGVMEALAERVAAVDSEDSSALTEIVLNLLRQLSFPEDQERQKRLRKLLAELPHMAFNPRVAEICASSPSLGRLTDRLVQFFKTESMSRETGKKMNEFMKDQRQTAAAVATLQRQIREETQRPFAEFLTLAAKSTEEQEKSGQPLFLFELQRYRKEVISWNFNIGFFNERVPSKKLILLTLEARNKLGKLFKEVFPGDSTFDKKLSMLPEVLLARSLVQDTLAAVNSQKATSLAAVRELLESRVPQFSLSFPDANEVHKKMQPANSSKASSFMDILNKDQMYVWTREEFEGMTSRLTNSGQTQKYKKFTESQLACEVPEAQFKAAFAKVADPQNEKELAASLACVERLKQQLLAREEGHRILLAEVERRQRGFELLKAVEDSD